MSKGIDFEREVKHFFERRGYTVFRQAMSAFPDLILIRSQPPPLPPLIIFVECKKGRKDYANTLSPAEREALLSFQQQFGIIPIHAKQIKEDGRYSPITFTLVQKQK